MKKMTGDWLSEQAGPGTVSEQSLAIIFEVTSENVTF